LEIQAAKGIAAAGDVKKFEAKKILKNLDQSDYLILLDERGKEFTSTAFATFLESKEMENRKHLVFLIGGSYGFDQSIYDLASLKISLSKMTLPHQIARLLMIEQLYRAFTIRRNESYHH
jgi:23S rRNA (pseudouridine1915-N3)-methyltransferase